MIQAYKIVFAYIKKIRHGLIVIVNLLIELPQLIFPERLI